MPLSALLFVLVFQFAEIYWFLELSWWQHYAYNILVYGLLGPALLWGAISALRQRVLEREVAELELKASNQKLEFLVRMKDKLAITFDEEQLLEIVMDLASEILPVLGCTLIHFDEYNRPLPPIHRGSLTREEFEALTVHLAARSKNESCEQCEVFWSIEIESCPLLKALPDSLAAKKAHCLEFVGSTRKYGLLHLYLDDAQLPNESQRELLSILSNDVSLRLDNFEMQARELATLRKFQGARIFSNLRSEIIETLDQIIDALDVDGSLIFLAEGDGSDLRLLEMTGTVSVPHQQILDAADEAFHAPAPYLVRDIRLENESEIELFSLLVAPLRIEGSSLGCLAIWSNRRDIFSQRRIQLITALAGQAALLLQNQRLYVQAEQHAVSSERSKIAREIHDGVAQTLGYLQLRLPQIGRWFDRGEAEQAMQALGDAHGLIDEAYHDTRKAIDGLRLSPESGTAGMSYWITQILDEFHHRSKISVETNSPPELHLSLEDEYHLMMIIQEALANIREHSRARKSWLAWDTEPGSANSLGVVLKICDDGSGFIVDDQSSNNHHGLNIMRERAEILNAGFEVISQPGEGTQVVLRLPTPGGKNDGEDN